jgi:hypothetical protein
MARILRRREKGAGKGGREKGTGPFIRTEPVNNTTTWAHGALNRLVLEANELGQSRYIVHNARGHLIWRMDRRPWFASSSTTR